MGCGVPGVGVTGRDIVRRRGPYPKKIILPIVIPEITFPFRNNRLFLIYSFFFRETLFLFVTLFSGNSRSHFQIGRNLMVP